MLTRDRRIARVRDVALGRGRWWNRWDVPTPSALPRNVTSR